MKKITFILLGLLISGTAFAQGQSATADVNAEVVEVLNIETTQNLNFGSFIANGGGVVTMTPGGARSFDNAGMAVTSGATPQAAKFEITAPDKYSYNIAIPAVTLSSGSNTMDATFSNEIGGITDATKVTGTGSAQILNVGGALTVGASQAVGEYEGTVEVTVSYE